MFPSALKTLALGGTLAACMALPCAQAAEYSFSPRVQQRFGYDDNLQLANDINAIETPSYQINPGLFFRGRGDNWQIEADAAIGLERFDPGFAVDLPDVRDPSCDTPTPAPGADCRTRTLTLGNFDTDNQRGRVSLRRFSERQAFQLDFSINREAQRTAGVLEAGLLVASRTEAVSVRPSYQRQLNERLSLNIGGTYQNRHFDATVLQDFKVTGLDAALTRQMSRTSSLTFSAFYQDFAAEPLRLVRPNGCVGVGLLQFECFFGSAEQARESTTLGVQLGWRKFVSEQLEFNVSVGGRDVEARNENTNLVIGTGPRGGCVYFFAPFPDGVPAGPCILRDDDSSDSSGLLAATSLTYRGERITHNVSLERSVSPVGLGFLVETDLLRGASTYKFSPRLTGTLAVRFLDSARVSDDLEDVPFDRRFYSYDASFAWQLSENWSVATGARFRDQLVDRRTQDDIEAGRQGGLIDAEGTFVYLNLTYRPQTLRVAR